MMHVWVLVGSGVWACVGLGVGASARACGNLHANTARHACSGQGRHRLMALTLLFATQQSMYESFRQRRSVGSLTALTSTGIAPPVKKVCCVCSPILGTKRREKKRSHSFHACVRLPVRF